MKLSHGESYWLIKWIPGKHSSLIAGTVLELVGMKAILQGLLGISVGEDFFMQQGP